MTETSPENHEYPSFAQQGKNLAKFSFDLIKRAIQSGALMLPPEIQEQRYEICRSCEWYDETENKCINCGCFLPAKVPFAIDSCPINKWSPVSEIFDQKFDEILELTKEDQK